MTLAERRFRQLAAIQLPAAKSDHSSRTRARVRGVKTEVISNTDTDTDLYKNNARPHVRAREDPATLPRDLESRRRSIAAALSGLNTRPGPSSFSRRFPSKPTAEPLAEGWYQTHPPSKKVYPVSELVLYWRLLWKQKFHTDTPRYEWWLKQHMLAWLQTDGWKRVEAIFEYAFQQWEVLRHRFSIEADAPYLGILWSYRKPIYLEMLHTRNKTWGAHFVADEFTESKELIFE